MKPLQIGPRLIGPGYPALLAAEIGINHNGDLALALEMIDAAAEAGADAVKFQNYRTEDFIADRGLTHTYRQCGQKIVESQYEMFKRCELDRAALSTLKRRCDERGVIFHSTPTSTASLDDLTRVDVSVHKNGSDYLTNIPLIEAFGRTRRPTVISTGMAGQDEIDAAVTAFRATGNSQMVLLVCTSAYPAPAEELHLRRIPALAAAHGCLVGLSDHSRGILAAVCAVSLGACWIEKHFTLDCDLPGPDQSFSADPPQFAELVQAVRTAEASLGSPELKPTAAEQYGRTAFRLSCAAARNLRAGQAIQASDVAFRRPGSGFAPAEAARLIGRRVRNDVPEGTLLTREHFND